MRRPLAILGAVLLSLPTLRTYLEGHLDPTTAATRFLVALVFAWAAAAGIGRMVAGYGPGADDPEGTEEGAADAAGLDPAVG